MTRQSCIYTGWVEHRRHVPVGNAFRYQLFMLYLDLAELEEVFTGRWFWSVERPNIASFLRRDHLGNPGIPLDEAVRDLVEARTASRPTGPIRILTHLRYFGHCFNPVSFYYCFDEQGQEPVAVVAEIHNTPWGEEFCYVMDWQDGEEGKGFRRFRFHKTFHVSPFMPMDIDYTWCFSTPVEKLLVTMENNRPGEKVFSASLSLTRQELNGKSLAKVLASYPPMTMKVISAIYWQALRLKLKGAPFFSHPENTAVNEEQQ
jgi:uncharacterized protein